MYFVILSAVINFGRLLGGVTKTNIFYKKKTQAEWHVTGGKGSVHKGFFYLILYE